MDRPAVEDLRNAAASVLGRDEAASECDPGRPPSKPPIDGDRALEREFAFEIDPSRDGERPPQPMTDGGDDGTDGDNDTDTDVDHGRID